MARKKGNSVIAKYATYPTVGGKKIFLRMLLTSSIKIFLGRRDVDLICDNAMRDLIDNIPEREANIHFRCCGNGKRQAGLQLCKDLLS